MLYRLHKPVHMFHSFVEASSEEEEPSTNVGGMLTFFPKLGPGVSYDVRAPVPGRVLNVRVKFESGDCWISHWNIHNFGLSRDLRTRVVLDIERDFEAARQSPDRALVIVAGDFNISQWPPVPAVPDGEFQHRFGFHEWRASRDQIWQRLFSKM
eukprot:5889264-Pyramimonas_sp.AAC.1